MPCTTGSRRRDQCSTDVSRLDLDAQQAPSGAFPCVIDWGGGRETRDENGFATAIVLRRLRRLGISSRGVGRALDFLESCAAPTGGAFSFWPAAARPPWAVGIPPDADDTAVMTLELYAQGRRTRAQARETLVDVLVAAAGSRPLLPGPPWWRAGAFPTWLRFDGLDRDHVLDCGVNANVLALMASLDARDLPGFVEAVDMVVAAVAWCQHDDPGEAALRADSIAPYYASPRAVWHILDDAVWCGVTELAEARDHFTALIGSAPAGGNALWRNAYGGPVWRCLALDLLDAS